MFFNPVLLLIDVFVLRTISRYRKIWVCLALGAAVALAGLVLGAIESTGMFHLIRMAAYGIFFHAPLLLIGTAVIFWKEQKRLSFGLAAIGAFLLAIAGYAFLIEPFWLEITHYEIASPKIRQPLRIVVIADLQTDRFGEYEERVLSEAMEQKPDLILMAGDYLQSPSGGRSQQIQVINAYLRQIGFTAPLGALAVQGNVDGDDFQSLFAGLEITPARFRQQFDLEELNVTCLSLSDSHSAQLQVENPDPKKFHLVIGHEPNFALGKIDADLLIAGHTHGGQVRFPLIGPLTTLSKVPKRWAAGMTDLPDGGKLLVSRGIGMERGDAPPLRFLCRPELAVIDLVPVK
jgi:predicted MPP superfamily phosphohydrolase